MLCIFEPCSDESSVHKYRNVSLISAVSQSFKILRYLKTYLALPKRLNITYIRNIHTSATRILLLTTPYDNLYDSADSLPRLDQELPQIRSC